MDQESSYVDTTQFTFHVSGTEQYVPGPPASDGRNKAAPASRSSSTATSKSSSSLRKSRKRVDASTSSSYFSSSAYQKGKRGSLFRLDRVAVWTAGIIVVASMFACVMAIFVSRYDQVPTTTLRPPIETEDPRVRLAAWQRGDIRLVYGWKTLPKESRTTSVEPDLTDNATITEFDPQTYSEVGSENSTDREATALETISLVTTGAPDEDSNGTMASPQEVFLAEAPQQPVQNDA